MTLHIESAMTPAIALSNLLAAVANKTVRRDDMALFYEDIILTHGEGPDPGIEKANMAILSRWSRSGLNRIRRLAWKRVEGGQR